ncbi:2-isopropylmalate synthase [bacterium]|nr:2-isopropylmalate synthase [bacterium]
MSDRVIIFDTTLRDGEQAPGCSMTVEQKVRMARQLERLGVDTMEAGFAIASDGDFEAVKRVAKEIRHCTVGSLARTKKLDIDRAWEALKAAKKPMIHTFIATSDIHLEHKLRMTREQVLETAVEHVRYAKQYTEIVEFSAEDAGRSDVDFLCQIFEAVIDAGATIINVPDTVGYAIPDEFGRLVRYIIEHVPNIGKTVVSVHCHNDLGLAVANSIAAVQNGARQVETTINGIGERAGNASMEEFVMALNTRQALMKLNTNVTTQEIFRTSQLLTNLTGMIVQRNKAIVGANAFAHEAGIHQDGMLKNKQTYEIMTPESVGIPKSELVLGKHSGRHALGQRFKELGYALGKEDLETAYKSFTKLADKKKEIYDADLIAIVQDEISEIPEMFEFASIQVVSGSELTPTATVKLSKADQEFMDSAVGDGPVDAACKAIDRITGIPGRLTSYSIHAVTKGKDALGEVLIQVEYQDRSYAGRGASTDIIEASAKAYLNAINRIAYAGSKSKSGGPVSEKL